MFQRYLVLLLVCGISPTITAWSEDLAQLANDHKATSTAGRNEKSPVRLQVASATVQPPVADTEDDEIKSPSDIPVDPPVPSTESEQGQQAPSPAAPRGTMIVRPPVMMYYGPWPGPSCGPWYAPPTMGPCCCCCGPRFYPY